MSLTINEKFYKLKFFYHIDPLKITERIKKSSIYKEVLESDNPDLSPLFRTIFIEMVKECSLFSAYIFPEETGLNYSFFNDSYRDNTMYSNSKTLLALCKISLFHHCLLHGFENQLSDSSLKNDIVATKFNKYPKFIELSGANDRDIERGYFASLELTEKDEENKPQDIFQKYHTTYFPRLLRDKTYYSYNLFEQKSSDQFPDVLSVPSFQSNPLVFLYKNSETQFLDKALQRNSVSDLIKRYINLYNKAENWKKEIITNAKDTILFEMFMEPAYGFSFFKDISNFLYYKIHESSSMSYNKFSYHDLEGQAFVETIKNYVSTLPIVYNRFILLLYACYAAINSGNLSDSSYPPIVSSTIGQRHSFVKQPNDKLATMAIQRIGSFFRMLNYCTVPILEYLWDVITDEKYLGITITLSHYTEYIEKYHDFITADYSCGYDQYASFWKEELKCDYSFERIYKRFSDHYRQSSVTETSFPDFYHRTESKNQLAFLIKAYCQTPIKPRLSIDEIILSQSADLFSRTRYCTEYDLFQKQYVNILYDFAEQYNPDEPLC